MSHFRPSGSCNITYRVINKVLVNKIKEVLPSLISPNQSSFVVGRHTTDNIVISQELVHTMRKLKRKQFYMASKVDLEKVYDRLKWSFIYNTLMDVVLPSQMINLIMDYVTSASFQIFWNGEARDKFHPSRGIRQGTTLSLFICFMVGKVISIDLPDTARESLASYYSG